MFSRRTSCGSVEGADYREKGQGIILKCVIYFLNNLVLNMILVYLLRVGE